MRSHSIPPTRHRQHKELKHRTLKKVVHHHHHPGPSAFLLRPQPPRLLLLVGPPPLILIALLSFALCWPILQERTPASAAAAAAAVAAADHSAHHSRHAVHKLGAENDVGIVEHALYSRLRLSVVRTGA